MQTPVRAPGLNARWMRRFVFSSSGDQTRASSLGSDPSETALRAFLSKAMMHVAESLFTTFFPADCRICHNPLSNISRLPVCAECLATIGPITGTLCSVCGERILSPFVLMGVGSAPRCGVCRQVAPKYERAMAYGSYEGALRELIHLLKYDGVRPASGILGQVLAPMIASLEAEFSEARVLVIPVPLHVSKRKQREFNQAELIASAAIKHLRSARFELRTDILERRRETLSQIGLSSHQRRENLRGAFNVTRPDVLKGREVVLVDDVLTTGTTASECARVLGRAGALKVRVATVARTLKYEVQPVRSRFGEDATIPAKMAAAG
jgi:ComF family protein